MPLPNQPINLKQNPLIVSPFVQDLRIGAPTPPPPGSEFRITDDDEFRITDSGDRRITD